MKKSSDMKKKNYSFLTLSFADFNYFAADPKSKTTTITGIRI